MYSIRRATESDLQEWNEFIYSCPLGSIFHSREWCDIHRRQLNATIVNLVAREEGRIIGAFSLRFGYYSFQKLGKLAAKVQYKEVVSPPIDIENPYGGPVCFPDRPDVFKALLLEAFRLAAPFGRAKVVFSPKLESDKTNLASFVLTNNNIASRETLFLDLTQSIEKIELGFIPDVRRNLRKSSQLGVRITEANQLSDVETYYQILRTTYQRSGLSPLPLEFYKDVFTTFMATKQIKLLFAVYEGKPIATTAFLTDQETVYSWTGGSLREFARYNGYTFIWRYMIELGKRIGYSTFDLTGIDKRLPGLARFKRSFGAELHSYLTLKWHSPIFPGVDKILMSHSERLIDFAVRHTNLSYFDSYH